MLGNVGTEGHVPPQDLAIITKNALLVSGSAPNEEISLT